VKSELDIFDGLDNRRELMVLLQRLGTDQRRADFITGLVGRSRRGFAGCAVQVVNCDPVAAYYMLVGCCNELGVSINEAARVLESEVRGTC
jgi:hypothetical protein